MTEKRYILEIGDFVPNEFDAIIDVRSPSEFQNDHIPGAINCPVLDDQQRAKIGTLYVQESSFLARKKGAVLVARNIANHIEEKFSDKPKNWRPFIYCWRGGQRSGAMQTVFRQIGWNAVLLKGGYKAYRSHVLSKLEDLPKQFKYVSIGGPTGSGKTLLLNIMAKRGEQVLDLEKMAGHKGSVLGFDSTTPKQSQKGFDTLLIKELSGFNLSSPVFVEAESRKIGNVQIPNALYDKMRESSLVITQIPIEERIEYLQNEYDWFIKNPNTLKEKLYILKEIRGKKTIERWFNLIDTEDWPTFIKDLLETHYDPLYKRSNNKGINNRTEKHHITIKTIDENELSKAADKIISLFSS